MPEFLQVDSIMIALILILLSIIAFFLKLMVRQLYKIIDEMVLLSGKVNLLEANNESIKKTLDSFEPMWAMLRQAHQATLELDKHGCTFASTNGYCRSKTREVEV